MKFNMLTSSIPAILHLAMAVPTNSHSTSSSSSHSSLETSATSSTTSTYACTPTNTFTYRATFDDLVVSNPVTPLVDFINTYDSIYWQAMVLADYTQGAPGNIPNSMPNFAGFSAGTQMVQGIPGMYSNYTGSTISNFTLYQFYYGCILNVPTDLVADPAACNITINGYSSNGSHQASQTFEFDPTGLTQQMNLAQVAGAFQHTNYVTFTYSQGGVSMPATIVAQIDSVVLTVFATGGLFGNS